MPESVKIEAAGHVQMGIVWQVTSRPDRAMTLSRAARAAVLYAGGLAQERLGVVRELGSDSHPEQGAALLREPRREAALNRTRWIRGLVWPDVTPLAKSVMGQKVLAGETAIVYVLAREMETQELIREFQAFQRGRSRRRSRTADPYQPLADLHAQMVRARRPVRPDPVTNGRQVV